MIKTEKDKIQEELDNKKKFFELRLQSLEKQESLLNDRLDKIRENLINKKKK
jgi:chaperonin cofactor prefoldin